MNLSVASPVTEGTALSKTLREQCQAIIQKYPYKRSALLEVLWRIQEETGYLSPTALKETAGWLELSPAQVYDAVSFYTMFRLKPPPRHHLQVCRSLSCALCGQASLRKQLRDRLGIGPGERTPDGLFEIEEVECLAACDQAPVLMINDTLQKQVTPERLDALLEKCRMQESRT
jgi:NADH-quinone oxidoreductase E subunit